jgi:hypothetical protein
VTLSKFVKLVSFAKILVRYIKPSIGLVGGKGGRVGQCLKAAYVFRQKII